MNRNESQQSEVVHQMRDAAKDIASDSAEVIRQAGQLTKERIKQPTTAAAIAGALAVGVAATFGILETAVGGAAAYLTYRVLRRRRADMSPSPA